MFSVILFLVLSTSLAAVCRKQLLKPKCHGFYRFFVFLGILFQICFLIDFLEIDPFSSRSLLSAALMLSSAGLVFLSYKTLQTLGGDREYRSEKPENFQFENTSEVVIDGVYKYMRHPMYSSLLFLIWGLYVQALSPVSLLISLASTTFLIATILTEEKENEEQFGTRYIEYKNNSKMLIPFII